LAAGDLALLGRHIESRFSLSSTRRILREGPPDNAEGPRCFFAGATEGERLLQGLARDGMAPHLVKAGFVGLGDFWEPWCVALIAGEIAAMAFAARIGPFGADVGVYTFPGFRGRGLAAAVTAAWSSLPELADRTLFYSTHLANRSSRRVIERLGLRRIGLSLSIP